MRYILYSGQGRSLEHQFMAYMYKQQAYNWLIWSIHILVDFLLELSKGINVRTLTVYEIVRKYLSMRHCSLSNLIELCVQVLATLVLSDLSVVFYLHVLMCALRQRYHS